MAAKRTLTELMGIPHGDFANDGKRRPTPREAGQPGHPDARQQQEPGR